MMNSLFCVLRERLAAGETVALVSIVRTEGSTPRKAGSLMLVDKDGWVCGSIGGAIVEHLAIEEGRRLIREQTDGAPKDFILRPNEISDIGAQCGGTITVSFTRLDPQTPGIDAIVDAIIAQHPADAGTVYIFGGGHVGQATEPLLSRLDFRCVVYDDRAEYADPTLFSPDARTICHPFSAIAEKITLTADDYCVVLTHGHQSDYEAFSFALESPARYIGVIGSKRKIAFVEGRLKAAGFTDTHIHAPRVHAPIGLDISSETPTEVAVSIAAELIMVRKKG
ncbi:MAG: XdhC/CoxI family protein [Spirochaetaceae bacterium]|jgi:xanthine dehydrogenase accessory factor|nr:XdhC/CoxI family protein [Spirochaetaceae bacterium]